MISVVIPTRENSPQLSRAISSVLAQTLLPAEIIIVTDAAEPVRPQLSPGRPELKAMACGSPMGANFARNMGIRAAVHDWIALLDDDDEWLPTRLQLQLEAALHSSWRLPIVFSQVILRTSAGDFIAPRRCPSSSDSIATYLFDRRSFLPDEVLLQTSSLLIPRSLLLEVPFRPELKYWQEFDWALRAAKIEGAGLEFVPIPLSVYYTADSRKNTITAARSWRYLFDWARNNRELFSPRTYSSVLLTRIAHVALQTGSLGALSVIIPEARRRARPSLAHVAVLSLLVFLYLLPAPVRQFLWKLSRKRAPSTGR